jgi:hypothetical protein
MSANVPHRDERGSVLVRHRTKAVTRRG